MTPCIFRTFDAATLDATLPAVAAQWPDLAELVRAAFTSHDRNAALDAIDDVRDALPLMTDATRMRGPVHVRALHALAMALTSDTENDARRWVRDAAL